MQRWAVSVGGGLPTDIWDDTPISKPPPLPEDMALVVDRCVMHAPRRQRLVLMLWYRTPQPTEVIARRINRQHGDLRIELSAALGHMRGELLRSGEQWLWKVIGSG